MKQKDLSGMYGKNARMSVIVEIYMQLQILIVVICRFYFHKDLLSVIIIKSTGKRTNDYNQSTFGTLE